MNHLPGEASDRLPEVLATGSNAGSTIVVSASRRHPEGRDEEYLRWHCFDHRPEQHRLAALRGSLRLVSTRGCRAVRAASSERYDAVDHVMIYLFESGADLDPFFELGRSLARAGRFPYVLPPVERGVFALTGSAANEAFKVGADVVPWYPAVGAYLLIEEDGEPPVDLVSDPGVVGAWWSTATNHPRSGAAPATTLTILLLDDDPEAVGARLTTAVQERWSDAGAGLLAAPFHLVDPRDLGAHLP